MSWLDLDLGESAITGLTGDVTATGSGIVSATVEKIQGVAITGTPSTGYVLTATGSTDAHWSAAGGSGITALTGDVTASGSGSVAATVAKIQGVAISGTPSAGQVLTASGSTDAAWATAGGGGDLGDLFGTSRVQSWAGGFDGGALSGEVNCRLGTSGGSGGAVGPTAGTYLQSTARIEQQAASGTGFCGFYNVANKNWAWRGNGAGLGGFTMYTSFGVEETNGSATMTIFAGLHNGAAASRPSAANFNTQTTLNVIGFGASVSTNGSGVVSPPSNWKIISCDAATTNLVDSGLAITKGHLYRFMLSCIAHDTIVTWKIWDLSAGTSATGTVNTNLPANDAFMGWQAGINVSVAGTGGDGSNSPSLASYALETLQ